MFGLDPLLFGILLLIIAVPLTGFVLWLLRTIPKSQTTINLIEGPAISIPVSNEILSNEEAFLMIQPGGRVLYANEKSRDWFNLPKEDTPNLEHLARKTRPSDTFLSLCASQGQARFSMQGLIVEGSSFLIPYEDSYVILVSLRRPDLTALTKDETSFSGEALDILTELNQEMTASLDLEPTIKAILESVERVIPVDTMEITIWEPDQEHLVPYGFVGVPGVDRRLEKLSNRYKSGEGYSGYLFREQDPLLIANVDTFRKVRPVSERPSFPFRAYLGVPLIAGQEPIGTLEVGSMTIEAFNESDLELVRLLSNQAAIAVQHALVHREEEKRVAELSGLAQLAQAVGNVQDQRNLFGHLIESINPLLDVEILGILKFDESENTIYGVVPFIGMPEQFVSLYRSKIETDTPAEKLWQSQKTIVAQNALESKDLRDLGLAYLAQTAGMNATVLTPLTQAGRSLGYLQAANKKDGSPFTKDDLRLLAIIAGQASPIIQNADLIQEARRRTQQAEALRRISGLVGSAATLDEILVYSLQELARLMQAEHAGIFLISEEDNNLQLHQQSSFGGYLDAVKRISSISSLPLEEMKSQKLVTQTLRTFSSGNLQSDEQLAPFYSGVIQALGIESGIVVPLVIRDRGVGEMMFGHGTINYFSRHDIELAHTAAGQIAGAIERSTLYSQTDEGLRRQVEQLRSISRISREINTQLDIRRALDLIFNEMIYDTSADSGTILLFGEPSEENLVPKIIHQIGETHPETLHAIELDVLESGKAIIVDNFETSDYEPIQNGTGAAMVVPILYQGEIIGLIDLMARTPTRFDKASLEIAQTLAMQSGIAIVNAQRYEDQVAHNRDLQTRMETLSKLLETNQALRDENTLEESLSTIASGIQEATPFKTVLISLYDPKVSALRRVSGVGINPETMQELKAQRVLWTHLENLLRPEFRYKQSYFIPVEKKPVVPPELHTVTLLSDSQNGYTDKWHPEDLLLIPLLDKDQSPLGLISVDAPRNGLRPDQPTIETIEIFAAQASLTIEGFGRLNDLNDHILDLESEVTRAKDANETTQSQLPFLLQKDVEQTLALHRLMQKTRRIQASLDIAQIVNKQENREAVLRVLGLELISKLEMDAALIAEPSPHGPVLHYSLGKMPADTNPETLLGQRNPLRHSLQSGELITAANLGLPSEDVNGWIDNPLLKSMGAASFISLPITVGASGEVDSSVLVVGEKAQPAFSREDKDIFALLGRQVGITLENLKLLENTRQRLEEVDLLLEFSRKLSSPDPIEILGTLVDTAMQVVPEAEAGLVVQWIPGQNELVPQKASKYLHAEQIMAINYQPGQALLGRVFSSGKAALIGEVDFAKDYNLSPENLVRYQEAMGGKVPISSLVVPIKAGENSLGVMVLDNFTIDHAFDENDEAIITSLARQTGLILENARLFYAADQRAAQLQALTDVATTITSNLQVDVIIHSLLDHLATVLPFETGTLWLRQENNVTIRAVRGFEETEGLVGLTVAVEDSIFLSDMIESGRPSSVPDVREDSRFLAMIEYERLSWLGIPLLSKGEVIGVVALEKTEPNFYTEEQIQAAVTFAGQTAVALENARLFEETNQQTVILNERTQRLDLLNQLSTELSSSLHTDQILRVTLYQMQTVLSANALSAVLFDGKGEARVHVMLPETDEPLPITLPNAPAFDRLRESLGVFITDNAAQEESLEPLKPFLESRNTKSLVMIPLATSNDFHGLLLIHSEGDRPPASEIDLARTVANQASIAIENARLFEQEQSALSDTEEQARRLSLLNQMSGQLGRVSSFEDIISVAVEATKEIFNVPRVSLSLVDEDMETMTLYKIAGEEKGLPEGTIVDVGNSLVGRALKKGTPLIENVTKTTPIEGLYSFLVSPLLTHESVVGTINIGSTEKNAFTESDENIMQQITSLVSAAIDNRLLIDQTRHLSEELEERVIARTRELEQEHKRNQTLLAIITELSASLDMDIVLNRTLERLNTIVDAQQSTIMLAKASDSTFLRRASIGYTPAPAMGGDQSALKLRDGLAGWVIENRHSVMIPDLHEDNRWVQIGDTPSQHRSAIAVPLAIGEEALGALLLYHQNANHFSEIHLDLIEATARQIAVAINNAQLYNLIRDQAERLGGMLRSQQVEASRSRAILEAVADGILVTDAGSNISLFNASAQRILELDEASVVGKNLDNFTGLFGGAGGLWLDTIRVWSRNPASYHEGDTFSEEIELDNGRIVSVNLALVSFMDEFLGTVSIFRDITHLVEVDRLKTEFIATVSHELRTPMTSIKGYVEILIMGAAGPITEQQKNFLEVVRSNTERLSILVSDLLDVSRIDATRVSLSMQAIDMIELAAESVAEYTQKANADNKNIDMLVEPTENLPRAYGDPTRVRQILTNLVDNSYLYTNEGSITIQLTGNDTHVRVDVKDTGVGIPPEDHERVFDRFYRGEDPLVLASAGTGLGLSIVQHLVEMQNGRIWFSSEGIPGKGSVFTFTIPTYRSELLNA